jgi:predicted DCC family thiol-disulfide oxidoreductase YuxK
MDQPKDILYFDGNCPLCTAEMGKLRRCADSTLELQDIHQLGDDPELPTRDELLRSLHLRSADGTLVSGLDANVAAWQHTRFAGLWRVLQWPVVKSLAGHAYQFWARVRYRRLYGPIKP